MFGKYFVNYFINFHKFPDVPVETVLFNYGWIGSILSGMSAFTWGCRCLPKESNHGLLLLLIGTILTFIESD